MERWRESLPRTRSAPIPARSLSLRLGWDPNRWRQLECLSSWSQSQRGEVETGVRGIAGRLDLSESAVEECVAHVLDGGPAPQLGPWREGQCPAQRIGRPRGTGRPLRSRQVGDADDSSPDEDPTPPPSGSGAASTRARLQRSVAAILRTSREGHLDEDEAAAAIVDMLAGRTWNSSMLSPPQAA